MSALLAFWLACDVVVALGAAYYVRQGRLR